MFTNGLGDLGSIPGHVIKMVLDTSFLNTQQYKVCIKGEVEQCIKSCDSEFHDVEPQACYYLTCVDNKQHLIIIKIVNNYNNNK